MFPPRLANVKADDADHARALTARPLCMERRQRPRVSHAEKYGSPATISVTGIRARLSIVIGRVGRTVTFGAAGTCSSPVSSQCARPLSNRNSAPRLSCFLAPGKSTDRLSSTRRTSSLLPCRATAIPSQNPPCRSRTQPWALLKCSSALKQHQPAPSSATTPASFRVPHDQQHGWSQPHALSSSMGLGTGCCYSGR